MHRQWLLKGSGRAGEQRLNKCIPVEFGIFLCELRKKTFTRNAGKPHVRLFVREQTPRPEHCSILKGAAFHTKSLVAFFH